MSPADSLTATLIFAFLGSQIWYPFERTVFYTLSGLCFLHMIGVR